MALINAYEIAKNWEKINGWSVSPGVSWCAKGNHVCIGEGAKVGARAKVGEWAKVGEGATFIADLGCPQNTYRVCLVTVDDVAQVHAGCRKLSLSAAKDHWMKHSQPRAEYVACVAYAKELCKMKKIRITPNKKAGAK